ncbi:hypothetical protein C4544_05260 [candidate division WS5 bacterium]|uniref:Uncharacterized protein n=1 Tax=candidate division WS5 bacterium TaxID=2093353 RepID=A0A419DBC7_9BACT|nr:MAG: hypothetical protein C4544_05260 [candidate division WS5 bacterium]
MNYKILTIVGVVIIGITVGYFAFREPKTFLDEDAYIDPEEEKALDEFYIKRQKWLESQGRAY